MLGARSVLLTLLSCILMVILCLTHPCKLVCLLSIEVGTIRLPLLMRMDSLLLDRESSFPITPTGGELMNRVMKTPPGRLHILRGGFVRRSSLVPTIVTWLFTATVLIRLRAMQMAAALRLRIIEETLVCTRICSPVLRPDSGLLTRNIVGLCMTVWFTVICRCRLLDSTVGPWLRNGLSLSTLVVCRTSRVTLLPDTPWTPRLQVTPLVIDRRGHSVQDRNITVTLWLRGERLPMMWLLTTSPLLDMLLSLVTTCRVADPL